MRHAIRASVLAFVAAVMMAIPCTAQDVEPPFTWKGEGDASFISMEGIQEDPFEFELSIDAAGLVSGQITNKDGSATIKHVFVSDLQPTSIDGYFTRNIVIVSALGGTPMISILNGRLLADRLLYGELLFAQYEAASDLADALGVDDPEMTLLDGGELPYSLRSALKKCLPVGTAKIVGNYTSQGAAATSAESEDTTIDLFNGRNLDGWHVFLTEDGKAADTLKVEDGAIVCTGTPTGFLRTKKAYSDYKLVLEWRWVGKPGNSGVLLHMTEKEKVWPLCIEAQLMHQRAGDMIGMGCHFNESTSPKDGPIGYISRMKDSSEKEPGGWNTYEITCKADMIEVSINGVLQNKITGVPLKKGYIGLQSEGVPIMFRNIKLTPLN